MPAVPSNFLQEDTKVASTGLRVYQEQERMREWIAQVESCRSSGLGTKEWCEQNGVSVHTYYKRQARVFHHLQSLTDPQFVEIAMSTVAPHQEETKTERIVAKIKYSKYEIEIYDSAGLVEVMQRC